jgi:5'-nucleotidase
VHLAITGLLEDDPDMVFSGINNGANMGDDVLYSGTVAAATEGRFLGLPSVAISMNAFNPKDYETGARVALAVMKRLVEQPLPADTILNINVPDVPFDALAGYQSTRLGQRHRAESVIEARDPRGRKFYWIGPAGAEQDAGEGTDFYAVKQNYVSVTPLQVDLTHYQRMQQVSDWLSDIHDS